MQIKGIALYSRSGERRDLLFRLGRLNIITGASSTGKSALIDVVEYCLGGRECTIAEEIQDVLSWVAVIVSNADYDVVCARPIPDPNVKTNSTAFLQTGSELSFPAFGDLHENANVDLVNELLTRAVGLNRMDIVPTSGAAPSETTVRHSIKLCFQAQNEIANRRILFHRQDEPFVALALKSTLPYVIGILSEEAIRLQRRLRHLKTQERQMQLSLPLDTENATAAEKVVAAELVACGLADEDIMRAPRSRLLGHFQSLVSHNYKNDFSGAGDLSMAIETARQEYESLSEQHRGIRSEISTLKLIAEETDGFQNAISMEIGRLSVAQHDAVELLDNSHCPLCLHELHTSNTTISAMRKQIEELRKQTISTQVIRPTINTDIDELESRASSLRIQLAEARAVLNELLERRDAMLLQHGRTLARAVAIARAELALQSSRLEDMALTNALDPEKLRRQINELELQLAAFYDDYEREALPQISSRMKNLSEFLPFQYSGHDFRLNVEDLTIEVKTKTGLYRAMSRIGSAQNWLACHLIAHLAIHMYFLDRQRPVPAMLIIDQPTQVYFPSDKLGTDISSLEDEDRIAVRSIFDLLARVVEEMDGSFQVIVTDHADLDNSEFQEHVLERWRKGAAFVPAHWFAEQ